MRQITGTTNLNRQVAEALREAIHTGELRPGELYSVTRLAETLGISRTPVREALLTLADTGLVRIERNRGFRVVRRNPRHIAEVFHLRLLLEVPATRLAATAVTPDLLNALRSELTAMQDAAQAHDEPRFMHHDRRFHALILETAGNSLLTNTVATLRDTITTVGASTADQTRSLSDIAAEHTPILRALEAADPEAAAQAMRHHITHTGELLVAQTAAENAEPVSEPDTALLHNTHP
ncbi:GntR family transcriptional regulator [Thermomonospora cellulosilytica]|uniref:DNA-binding GntR family transcriptional regulator n=1 Tax=Thermomonospora cellulosilytica TaxID=1411118 RepID=A0A7W3MWU4_9ACTN|nr:GntR family transcriptional regulator [Thermomonospora cellulosilytica]MBA9003277.1 DNA-binding GntR family transcriptional regulator [Thermomonospora cellulosilytica]